MVGNRIHREFPLHGFHTIPSCVAQAIQFGGYGSIFECGCGERHPNKCIALPNNDSHNRCGCKTNKGFYV